MPACRRLSRRSLLAAGLPPWLSSCARRASGPPLNFVLILADDLGYGDLSSFGAPDIRTPNIDSIGARGVRFTACYANAPECTPTRTALLTGRYQQRVGGLECAIGVGDVGRYDEAEWLQKRGELGLPAGEPTLGRIFKNHGYDTACIGKWHLGYAEKFSPLRHGFDEHFGILGGNADYFRHTEAGGRAVLYENGRPVERQGYLTHLLTGRAVEWLKGRAGRPFFLYLPYTAPHSPLQGPDDAARPLNDADWNEGDRATYARMVEAMDEGVGRVLAQLDSMGAAGNTLVLFVSDNGGYRLSRNEPYRGGKSTVWEGGIRVPCLARCPGVLPEGGTTPQVTLTMDLLPTFLAAAGLAAPAGRPFDGMDLLSAWQGRREPMPRTVFWRYKRGGNRRKAVRHGHMKYLRDGAEEGLFHLGEDPREQRNLAAEMPDILEDLKAKLDAWEEEVRAPRLKDFPAA